MTDKFADVLPIVDAMKLAWTLLAGATSYLVQLPGLKDMIPYSQETHKWVLEACLRSFQ